jgi:hypothetical protein
MFLLKISGLDPFRPSLGLVLSLGEVLIKPEYKIEMK